jgi:hypothetical protein
VGLVSLEPRPQPWQGGGLRLACLLRPDDVQCRPPSFHSVQPIRCCSRAVCYRQRFPCEMQALFEAAASVRHAPGYRAPHYRFWKHQQFSVEILSEVMSVADIRAMCARSHRTPTRDHSDDVGCDAESTGPARAIPQPGRRARGSSGRPTLSGRSSLRARTLRPVSLEDPMRRPDVHSQGPRRLGIPPLHRAGADPIGYCQM